MNYLILFSVSYALGFFATLVYVYDVEKRCRDFFESPPTPVRHPIKYEYVLYMSALWPLFMMCEYTAEESSKQQIEKFESQRMQESLEKTP